MTDVKLIFRHLEVLRRECSQQSKIFWAYYYKLSYYDSLISIPNIVLSSITGLSSLSALTPNSTDSEVINSLSLLTPVFAITATILASLNKYFRYGERAQKAKSQAKTLTEIDRRIQRNIILSDTDMEVNRNLITRIIEDIYRELDTWDHVLEEKPEELLSILNSFNEEKIIDSRSSSHNLNTKLNAVQTQSELVQNSAC
jgi:signal transduction histidine kinase